MVDFLKGIFGIDLIFIGWLLRDMYQQQKERDEFDKRVNREAIRRPLSGSQDVAYREIPSSTRERC